MSAPARPKKPACNNSKHNSFRQCTRKKKWEAERAEKLTSNVNVVTKKVQELCRQQIVKYIHKPKRTETEKKDRSKNNKIDYAVATAQSIWRLEICQRMLGEAVSLLIGAAQPPP